MLKDYKKPMEKGQTINDRFYSEPLYREERSAIITESDNFINPVSTSIILLLPR